MTFDIPDNVPMLCVSDRGRLRQIVSCLTLNALKFSTNKPTNVKIEANVEKSLLCVTVTDEGIGMSQEQID